MRRASYLQHMQPLQPMSIKLFISLLRIQFVKAGTVLTDLSAVDNLPHSLGKAESAFHK